MYKGNLPAFMAAIEKDISLVSAYHPFIVDDDELIPFMRLPDVIFSWEFKMADEVKEGLVKQIGDGRLREVVRGGKTVYIAPLDSYEKFTYIRQLKANLITPAFDETANLKSIPLFKMAHRIVSRFTAIHQYPAWVDQAHLDEWKKYHQKHIFEDDHDESAHDEEMEVEEDGSSKEVKVGDITLSAEKGDIWVGRDRFNDAKVVKQSRGKGFISDPSNTDIELGDGIFVPFVAPLAHYDGQTVPDVIRQYFSACLGEDADDVHQLLHTTRTEWGVLGNTTAGKAMTHLFFCMRLAIESQARLLPYVNESSGYNGSFILGAGFTISVGTYIKPSVPMETLKASFQKASFHHRGLETILSHLEGLDEEALNTLRHNTSTIMQLKRAVENSWMHIKDKAAITKAASLLNFNQTKWRINAESIARLLSLLNNSGPLPDDLPVSPSYLTESDRLTVLLSCFGDFAPTFKVAGGREVPLDSLEVTIKKAPGVKDSGKKDMSLTRIGCRTVPVSEAVADWRWVKESKKIQTPFWQPKEKASQEHFTRFFSGDNLQVIVTGLRQFAMINRVEAGGSGGGKKREFESDEAGSSKKKRRGLLDD
ncbi:hypothetical protein [Rhizoctonia solani ambivirus 2]|nr:hypothetical protein [Rhizoctonia solani ambivirus 2]